MDKFSIPAFVIERASNGTDSYSLSMQILLFMTCLTLLPAIILSMTSFTRVVVVLSILRQALGMPQTPSNQILIGISLFMTFFIMAPVLNIVNQEAIGPYLNDKISINQAIDNAQKPIKNFIFSQTREKDLQLFATLGSDEANAGPLTPYTSADQVSFAVLLPAFVISELKTAFELGFLIFIPFLIIDFVVASVLMSMGMMMLSPLVISLPFKIMLFVLVDGWSLIVGTLTESFSVIAGT